MQLGGHADFLRPFIWSHVFHLTQFHHQYETERASHFVQIFEKMQQRPDNDWTSVQGRKNDTYMGV
jgi:hypothetical protein